MLQVTGPPHWLHPPLRSDVFWSWKIDLKSAAAVLLAACGATRTHEGLLSMDWGPTANPSEMIVTNPAAQIDPSLFAVNSTFMTGQLLSYLTKKYPDHPMLSQMTDDRYLVVMNSGQIRLNMLNSNSFIVAKLKKYGLTSTVGNDQSKP